MTSRSDMSTKRELKIGGIYSVDWIAGDGLGSALWSAMLRWDGKRWLDERGRAKNITPKVARLVPLRLLHDAWKVKLAVEVMDALRENPPSWVWQQRFKVLEDLFTSKRRLR